MTYSTHHTFWKHLKTGFCTIVLLAAQGFSSLLLAQQTDSIALNGSWSFALDPVQGGEKSGWQKPWEKTENSAMGYGDGWDQVTVPHSFSVDERYEGYIGKVWYRKSFTYGGNASDKHLRLHFEGVFYQCRIWLNGQYVGAHEGGYTPFAFAVTDLIQEGENYLAVEVDNAWDYTTIPGARFGDEPKDLLYPWWEYGGITREVYLIETGKVFVDRQKIEAMPDLKSGKASVTVKTWLRNEADTPAKLTYNLSLNVDNKSVDIRQKTADQIFTLPPQKDTMLVREVILNAAEVRLWHFDHPHLYQLQTSFQNAEGNAMATYQVRFGIRKVEARQGKLFLNGEAVRIGGANRHADHPVYASLENDTVVQTDMTLMKKANMLFSRLTHTPSTQTLMDWCDENGYLVIGEAGNWQMSPQQMADPVMRAKFARQMTELIRRDWNHPSIIGWSVGNEYQAWTPKGDTWTKDMISMAKALDSTRLFTFASLGNGGSKQNLQMAHDSFRYCDLLMINLYSGPKGIEEITGNLHRKYPDKPVFISEFGLRADYKTEEERSAYFQEVVESIRPKDYIVGVSWWSFNDYRSRFPNTNVNGYREWGLVDPHRKERPLYFAVREALSPITVSARTEGKESWITSVSLTARDDFPRYTLQQYHLCYQLLNKQGKVLDEQDQKIETLKPGQTATFIFKSKKTQTGAAQVRLEVRRPTGFSTIVHMIDLGKQVEKQ